MFLKTIIITVLAAAQAISALPINVARDHKYKVGLNQKEYKEDSDGWKMGNFCNPDRENDCQRKSEICVAVNPESDRPRYECQKDPNYEREDCYGSGDLLGGFGCEIGRLFEGPDESSH